MVVKLNVYNENWCREAYIMSAVVEKEVFGILERLRNEYPEKSPYIFGPGFEQSGFKTFNVDDEMVIPGSICINSQVLKVLSDYKTSFHLNSYMKNSNRSATIAPNIPRTASMIIMISSVSYSFHVGTFPFCNNAVINQMWADIGQMIKGDHVCCTLLAAATRGRSDVGFSKKHAAKSTVPQVERLQVPTFDKQKFDSQRRPVENGRSVQQSTMTFASAVRPMKH